MKALVSNLVEVEIPKTIEEALLKKEWKNAVEEEIKALEKNGTWEVVSKPRDVILVGCKWVFTGKYKSDGSIERYKARLVAKGFTQTYGIDCHETLALIAKLNTIKVLLSPSSNLDWPLQQLDIKNAFLNEDLSEEAYMDLHPGFKEMTCLKKRLAKEFEIKDLGPLRYFLGMEIARNRSGIFVSQRKYDLDLLKETGLLGCKLGDTPVDPNIRLSNQNSSAPVDKGRYQRLVGKLIYLVHTRPNIAFAFNLVGQFMHAPYEEHLEVVMRILKYPKGSPRRGLFFKKGQSCEIEAYANTNWASSEVDRRSTSG
ncbi:Retrovirus-related Pol polyprotein from transposon RE1 [Vitis vinifera]|uniref:Retrovirus-related Pol polyprotein from transposon RE1 n=1 Tax=Vitis vinifera TaxID=29760 RepID=A0A438BYW0_VITVI|nr:Retrovirus-related Pol polyprotein from transposon RE1 [Vitis vinifera]